MLTSVLVIALVVTCAVTDLVYHKIYNAVTYPGIVMAFVVATATSGWDGPGGLEESLSGFALCGGLMFAAFLFFNVGGGDVKLLAMLGAFLGIEQGVEALLWTFVIGGVFAVTILVWRFGAWNLFRRVSRHVIWTLRLGRPTPLTTEERAMLEPPLYLATAAVPAVLIVCFDLDRFLVH